MILRPTVSATLGNLRYDAHAVAVQVSLALLPRGGSVEIHLPASVRFEAEPGDDAQVDVDGGEGSERILTGKVHRVSRTPFGITAYIQDAGGVLAAFRPSVTYESQGASQVIQQLASDAGVEAQRVDVDLQLAAYVAHPRWTAAQHVAALCRLGGCLGRISGEGALEVIRRPSGQPEKALLYGREFTEYRSNRRSVPNTSRFAMGFGPAGSPSAPNAFKQTSQAIPSSAPDGGIGVLREAAPMLRSASAASDASTALQEAAAASSERLHAKCFLLPGMRPGDVVEVQSLPAGLSGGPWLLTGVTHRLSPEFGGSTLLEAVSADTSSLLGGLLGAIGGLV